jgi:diphthamide biosynthesis protein 2
MTDPIHLTVAPVLSTPETHIFEDPTPITTTQNTPRLTDDEIWDVYEISRTVREVREGGYKRVALQFPDGMLKDAPRVFEVLEKEMKKLPAITGKVEQEADMATSFNHLSTTSMKTEQSQENRIQQRKQSTTERIRLYILADTSYGSCCVDEIAAEHVDADVVVHYGRSCLSPTARLPVIYVFTTRSLDITDVVQTFESTFPSKEEKVVLMADITYNTHIPSLHNYLLEAGYTNLVTPPVIHDPSSQIPNRELDASIELKEYSLFHVSDPPQALLLTLSSRVKEMFIYPTTSGTTSSKAIQANTAMTLRRRYALLTRLSTCPIFGILINTLSVTNYLSTISSIRSLISSSGKKSYTFVVGKVNAAKIANFSEIGGWVVVGCWESSLIESSEFYRPIITPFELGLCLIGDEKRIWDGRWRGDFGGVEEMVGSSSAPTAFDGEAQDDVKKEENHGNEEEDSEEESAPPEFDLRTGRYVSHSRPMRSSALHSAPQHPESSDQSTTASKVLTRRANGDLVTVNGTVSPGAEYLKNQRTWQGLGSDFAETEASEGIEEGRSGVARGYTVGEGGDRT